MRVAKVADTGRGYGPVGHLDLGPEGRRCLPLQDCKCRLRPYADRLRSQHLQHNESGKEVEGLVKTTKGNNLTEEGVMAEIGKLQLSHDKVGGSGFDINNYAQSMIKSAESGNAFASSDMLMDDVKKLVPENVERDDADYASDTGEAAAGAEDGQDVGEDEPLKKKAKKEVFVDMQKLILDKQTRA